MVRVHQMGTNVFQNKFQDFKTFSEQIVNSILKLKFWLSNLTKRTKLTKVYPCLDIWVMMDTFQEFIFNLFVYGANMWIVFVDDDIQNMILNNIYRHSIVIVFYPMTLLSLTP